MKAIVLVVITGFLIRIYQFPKFMPFLQDQGWFYISARDLVLIGNIPFVGITSSHPWLHQGPIWTYLLAIAMKIFGFSPVIGGLFAILIGTISIYLLYVVFKRMFSHRVGLIASVLFAFSPIVVFHSRMSYHTMPIPFLMILLLYSVFRWVKGDKRFFPLIFLLTALLYNFELSTVVIFPVFASVFVYGLLKKKEYARKVLNSKTIFLSGVAFLIPMVPVIVYDLSHGFPQTFRFIAWIGYRFAVFLGYPPLHPNAPGETWVTFFSHFSIIIERMIFIRSFPIAAAILIFSFVYLAFRVYKKRINEELILFLYLTITILGYIVTKTNSEAYLLIALPAVFGSIAIFLDSIARKRLLFIPVVLFILLIVTLNSKELIKTSYLSYSSGYGPPYKDRLDVSKKIIEESKGQDYNIVGRGWGSQYDSFTRTYEYLTWWNGHPPSKTKKSLKFYITELPGRIVLEKK